MDRKRRCEFRSFGVTLVVLACVLGEWLGWTVWRWRLTQDLRKAIGSGNYEAMRPLVLKGADANALDEFSDAGRGDTALMEAASHGDLPFAQELLARGAKVDTSSSKGRTALQFAAFRGHLRLVEVLLKAGADVNRQDGEQETALTYAVMAGHIPVVKLLLQHGAVCNLPSRHGETALSLARKCGKPQAVRLLVRVKAAKWPKRRPGSLPRAIPLVMADG